MSLNDFNSRARLTVVVSINGSGQFSPFLDSYGVPMNWTLNGAATSLPPEIALTVKEQTCGLPFGSPKLFRFFDSGANNTGSTGNNSGTLKTGEYAQLQRALYNFSLKGSWIVNTSPILEPGGIADDESLVAAYYTVALPENADPDDPILVSPAIDFVARVYPGDVVYVSGSGPSKVWRVASAVRFPKPDRTFSWTPNSNPLLASGGLANGELAKPGTIMLPTSNFYIEPPAPAIDGMRYFYANQGVVFDGQIWRKFTNDPLIYDPPEGEKEFRDINVNYNSTDLYESLQEETHSRKCFVYTNQTIDDTNPFEFVVTPEQGDPETTQLFFRWLSPMNGVETNMQPGIAAIHNFGDAWTNYHLANRAWLKTRFPGLVGAGFNLRSRDIVPEMSLDLSVECFEDDNVTQITEYYTDFEGNVLTNQITITLSVTTELGP